MKHIQHVHRHLTLLFTALTGAVLIAMSLGYLYMSEKEWREKSYLTFLNTSNTILSHIGESDTIHMDYLSDVARENNFAVAVYDNNRLLNYSENNLSPAQKALAASALSRLTDDPLPPSLRSNDSSVRRDFTLKDNAGTNWYANTAQFGSSPPLCAVILNSSSGLQTQLLRQRLLFLAVDLIGLAVLFLITTTFVGRILAPVRESQRRQDEFVAAASHELRTPLAVILSSLEVSREADETDRQKFMDTIEKESRRMSTLIDDLLLLAGMSSSQYKFRMESTELDTLLLNTYETFYPVASQKNHRLLISLPEQALPPCPCDPGRISQVLDILLSNAVSHGREQGTIRLSLRYSSPFFLLSVADNGPGISDEAKPHIFERFYREEKSRSKKEHFGLGLSIAKEIADAHHGQITITDTPGGGASFTLYLPDKV